MNCLTNGTCRENSKVERLKYEVIQVCLVQGGTVLPLNYFVCLNLSRNCGSVDLQLIAEKSNVSSLVEMCHLVCSVILT